MSRLSVEPYRIFTGSHQHDIRQPAPPRLVTSSPLPSASKILNKSRGTASSALHVVFFTASAARRRRPRSRRPRTAPARARSAPRGPSRRAPARRAVGDRRPSPAGASAASATAFTALRTSARQLVGMLLGEVGDQVLGEGQVVVLERAHRKPRRRRRRVLRQLRGSSTPPPAAGRPPRGRRRRPRAPSARCRRRRRLGRLLDEGGDRRVVGQPDERVDELALVHEHHRRHRLDPQRLRELGQLVDVDLGQRTPADCTTSRSRIGVNFLHGSHQSA